MPRACLTPRVAHNPRPEEVASLRAVEGEWPAAVREALEADLRRVVDRLRTLSPAQLAGAVGAHPSRAAGGRAVAALLAVAAQGIEERSSGVEPRWRPLPELSDFAVGDQVAVTGKDLLGLLPPPTPSDHRRTPHPSDHRRIRHPSDHAPSRHPSDHAPSRHPSDHAVVGILVRPEETVWAPGTRRTAVEVLTQAAAEVAALRRLL